MEYSASNCVFTWVTFSHCVNRNDVNYAYSARRLELQACPRMQRKEGWTRYGLARACASVFIDVLYDSDAHLAAYPYSTSCPCSRPPWPALPRPPPPSAAPSLSASGRRLRSLPTALRGLEACQGRPTSRMDFWPACVPARVEGQTLRFRTYVLVGCIKANVLMCLKALCLHRSSFDFV